jgi:hypothetical protein
VNFAGLSYAAQPYVDPGSGSFSRARETPVGMPFTCCWPPLLMCYAQRHAVHSAHDRSITRERRDACNLRRPGAPGARNLGTLLREAGGDYRDIMFMQLYLLDMARIDQFNEIFRSTFLLSLRRVRYANR